MKDLRRTIVASAVLALACAADARPPIAIVNHGFEADTASPNLFSLVLPQGWTLHDPFSIHDFANDTVGVLNPTGGTNFSAGAPEGTNVALIYLGQDSGGGEVGLQQTLSQTLTANTRYTLRVLVGNIASGVNAPPFNFFFNLEGFPGYRVDLLAGENAIASDENTLANQIPEGEFRESVLSIDVDATHEHLGQPLTIRLVNLNMLGTPQAPGIEVDFDDVRLDAQTIPPPCPGDADNDGAVTFADITAVLANFNAQGNQPLLGDANRDGVVTFADITDVLANFGAAC